VKPRGSTPPSRQARCSRSLISYCMLVSQTLGLAWPWSALCPTESARSALTVLLPCCLPRLHLDCTVNLPTHYDIRHGPYRSTYLMLLGARRPGSCPQSLRCNFNSTLNRPLVGSGSRPGPHHRRTRSKAPAGPEHAKSILRIPWSPALHFITYHLSPTS
jgi:hypothetical protein